MRDARGREYLDANSSIWTNLHGHNHPRINSAIQRQLEISRIPRRSAWPTNRLRSLAEKLVQAANRRGSCFTFHESCAKPPRKSQIARPKLEKVFFSDDGSTALEVALKLAYEFTLRTGARAADRVAAARTEIPVP